MTEQETAVTLEDSVYAAAQKLIDTDVYAVTNNEAFIAEVTKGLNALIEELSQLSQPVDPDMLEEKVSDVLFEAQVEVSRFKDYVTSGVEEPIAPVHEVNIQDDNEMVLKSNPNHSSDSDAFVTPELGTPLPRRKEFESNPDFYTMDSDTDIPAFKNRAIKDNPPTDTTGFFADGKKKKPKKVQSETVVDEGYPEEEPDDSTSDVYHGEEGTDVASILAPQFTEIHYRQGYHREDVDSALRKINRLYNVIPNDYKQFELDRYTDADYEKWVSILKDVEQALDDMLEVTFRRAYDMTEVNNWKTSAVNLITQRLTVIPAGRQAAEDAEQHRQEIIFIWDMAHREDKEFNRVRDARLEAERLEEERLEAERVEAERVETERLEFERLTAELAEVDRIETERAEAERLEEARATAEREQAWTADNERVERERVEAEHFAAMSDTEAPEKEMHRLPTVMPTSGHGVQMQRTPEQDLTDEIISIADDIFSERITSHVPPAPDDINIINPNGVTVYALEEAINHIRNTTPLLSIFPVFIGNKSSGYFSAYSIQFDQPTSKILMTITGDERPISMVELQAAIRYAIEQTNEDPDVLLSAGDMLLPITGATPDTRYGLFLTVK